MTTLLNVDAYMNNSEWFKNLCALSLLCLKDTNSNSINISVERLIQQIKLNVN